jgi:hypothetical protein
MKEGASEKRITILKLLMISDEVVGITRSNNGINSQ